MLIQINMLNFEGDKLPEWINVVGLLLSYLPPVFWDGLHNRYLIVLFKKYNVRKNNNIGLQFGFSFQFLSVFTVIKKSCPKERKSRLLLG